MTLYECTFHFFKIIISRKLIDLTIHPILETPKAPTTKNQ